MSKVNQQSESFVNQLISWYRHQKRDLPWRNTNDPYKIWLSEIILQQTRVAQGMPYYLKFIKEFPTIFDLAEANEGTVLRLWQGLGYYSRARNLHQCSKTIVSEYDGQFPEDFESLLKLKGIGRYTAAAISSAAFNKVHAVVDGNVYRVLSRYFGVHDDIAESKSAKVFEKLANSLITNENPGEYNQAIMDFGAIQCTPKNPKCAICPVQHQCYAFNKGEISLLPVKSKKVKVRKLFFSYLVFEHENKLLMKQRDASGIWKNLFEFYQIESSQALSDEEVLKSIPYSSDIEIIDISKLIKHILTHRQILAKFYRLRPKEMNTFVNIQKEFELKAYDLNEIEELAKPILIDNYLKSEFS